MSATMTKSESGKGGTTLVRRPRRASTSSREPERTRDQGFDLAAWVHGMVPRLDDGERVEEVAPRRESPARKPAADAPDARRAPFDLTAWVHDLVPRVEETPVEAPRPRVAARREQPFDLSAWVHGVAPRAELTPPVPTNVAALRRQARPAPAPARKALTLPDLFEGPAVPPCLEDE